MTEQASATGARVPMNLKPPLKALIQLSMEPLIRKPAE